MTAKAVMLLRLKTNSLCETNNLPETSQASCRVPVYSVCLSKLSWHDWQVKAGLPGIIRRHRWQAISLCHRCYRFVVSLSFCHVRALCSNGRRYRQGFFLHTTAPCLSQVVLKFGLHQSTPSCPDFASKKTLKKLRGAKTVSCDRWWWR